MNLPKLVALVVVLVLATGCTLAWYVEGAHEVRAERMAVELEIARFAVLDPEPEARACEPAEPVPPREADAAPDLRECPFVPGRDRA